MSGSCWRDNCLKVTALLQRGAGTGTVYVIIYLDREVLSRVSLLFQCSRDVTYSFVLLGICEGVDVYDAMWCLDVLLLGLPPMLLWTKDCWFWIVIVFYFYLDIFRQCLYFNQLVFRSPLLYLPHPVKNSHPFQVFDPYGWEAAPRTFISSL